MKISLLAQKVLTDVQLKDKSRFMCVLQYVPNQTKIYSGKSLINIKI